jgi:hypothetical protein
MPRSAVSTSWMSRTYPDSVRRVKPPNTTMPKTLAALPSSQYATLFDDVFGKLLDLAPLVAASASIDCPACDAPMVALLRNGCVDFHLTECEMVGRGAEHRAVAMEDRSGELRHGWHTNRRRESRGAAVRSCGNAWNMEAIRAWGEVREESGRKERCSRRCHDFLVVRGSGDG